MMRAVAAHVHKHTLSDAHTRIHTRSGDGEWRGPRDTARVAATPTRTHTHTRTHTGNGKRGGGRDMARAAGATEARQPSCVLEEKRRTSRDDARVAAACQNISPPSCQVSSICLPYRSCPLFLFLCVVLSFSLSLFLSFPFLPFSLSALRLRLVQCVAVCCSVSHMCLPYQSLS